MLWRLSSTPRRPLLPKTASPSALQRPRPGATRLGPPGGLLPAGVRASWLSRKMPALMTSEARALRLRLVGQLASAAAQPHGAAPPGQPHPRPSTAHVRAPRGLRRLQKGSRTWPSREGSTCPAARFTEEELRLINRWGRGVRKRGIYRWMRGLRWTKRLSRYAPCPNRSDPHHTK